MEQVDGCCSRSQVKVPHITPHTFVSGHIWSGSSQGSSAQGHAGVNQEQKHRIKIHHWQHVDRLKLWCIQLIVSNFPQQNDTADANDQSPNLYEFCQIVAGGFRYAFTNLHSGKQRLSLSDVTLEVLSESWNQQRRDQARRASIGFLGHP